MKYFFSLTVLLLILGCTSASHQTMADSLSGQLSYHHTLQKTEKIQFYDNNITTLMFTVTYLYPPLETGDNTHHERFIVGMQTEYDDISNDLENLYHLTLDTHIPINIKPLDAQESILKQLSFVTPWGHYYLITFPHTKHQFFDLVFQSKQYGRAILHFAKVAKYTL